MNNVRDIATSTIVVAFSREKRRSDRKESATKYSLDKIRNLVIDEQSAKG